MKKVYTAVFLMMLFLLGAGVFPNFDMKAEAAANRLVDDAGLLTASEFYAVEETLDTLSMRNQFDIIVVTKIGLDGKTPRDYADDFYDENGYGWGTDWDGALLLIDMEEYSWYISTCGRGIPALHDRALMQIEDEILPRLSSGNYAEAFIAFAEASASMVSAYDMGGYDSYDTDTPYNETSSGFGVSPVAVLVAIGIGVLGGFLGVGVMKSPMKTVRYRNEANDYLRQGSFQLYRQQDAFLYSHTTRIRKPENNDRSGGGGFSSTHSSSSGRTHGGSGGKF